MHKSALCNTQLLANMHKSTLCHARWLASMHKSALCHARLLANMHCSSQKQNYPQDALTIKIACMHMHAQTCTDTHRHTHTRKHTIHHTHAPQNTVQTHHAHTHTQFSKHFVKFQCAGTLAFHRHRVHAVVTIHKLHDAPGSVTHSHVVVGVQIFKGLCVHM